MVEDLLQFSIELDNTAVKFPINQIACGLSLFQSFDVFAVHSFREDFLTDWNRTLDECIYYFFLLELQIEDVKVFATHVVAYNWNSSINVYVPSM